MRRLLYSIKEAIFGPDINPFMSFLQERSALQRWDVDLSRVLPRHFRTAVMAVTYVEHVDDRLEKALDVEGPYDEQKILNILIQWQLVNASRKTLEQSHSIYLLLKKENFYRRWQWKRSEILFHVSGLVKKESSLDNQMYKVVKTEYLDKDTKKNTEIKAYAEQVLRVHDLSADGGISLSSDDQREKLKVLNKMQRDSFNKLSESKGEREMMKTLDIFIGAYRDEAQMRGYKSTADFLLSNPDNSATAANSKDKVIFVQALIDRMNASLTPYLKELKEEKSSFRRKRNRDAAIDNFVTLNAAMAVANELFTSQFNMRLEETDSIRTWKDNIRSYHVYSTTDDSYLGSFILDPLRRSFSNKIAWNNNQNSQYASYIVPPTWEAPNVQTCPLICVNTTFSAPWWGDFTLSLDNVATLWHELGHVCQLLTPRMLPSCFLIPIPKDLVEVMPMFMEQYLMRESTITRLAELSNAKGVVINTDVMQALHIKQRNAKANEYAVLNMTSALELELFHYWDNDNRDSENIFQLQQRLGQKYMPHNVPRDKFRFPILRLVHESITGQFGQHRYLWGEILAAQYWKRIDKSSTMKDNYNVNEMLIPVTPSQQQNVVASMNTIVTKVGNTKVRTLDPSALLRKYHLL